MTDKEKLATLVADVRRIRNTAYFVGNSLPKKYAKVFGPGFAQIEKELSEAVALVQE